MTGQILDLAANHSRLVGAGKGNYRVWRSSQGAELWFHYPQRAAPRPAENGATANAAAHAPERPVAITPFHRGLSTCALRIGRYLPLDRLNPLAGSCMARLPPHGEGAQEQVVVVELAPFGLQPLRTPPYKTMAQIVFFAHSAWAFPDLNAYGRQTPSHRRLLYGSVSTVSETDVPEVKVSSRKSPLSLTLATGVVRRTIRHINPVTREPYYWLLLETRRGSFDVVVNPAQVEGDISEGHIAQVCGTFTARLSGTPV